MPNSAGPGSVQTVRTAYCCMSRGTVECRCPQVLRPSALANASPAAPTPCLEGRRREECRSNGRPCSPPCGAEVWCCLSVCRGAGASVQLHTLQPYRGEKGMRRHTPHTACGCEGEVACPGGCISLCGRNRTGAAHTPPGGDSARQARAPTDSERPDLAPDPCDSGAPCVMPGQKIQPTAPVSQLRPQRGEVVVGQGCEGSFCKKYHVW